MPYFTHGKLVEWIDAGRTLGFEVKSDKRRKAHGKIFQIDSMWYIRIKNSSHSLKLRRNGK